MVYSVSMYELEKLIAAKFISRTDVKAIQRSIAYEPLRRPWTRQNLTDHLEKRATYGHYLVNTDDTCKLFCLDIDIKAGQGYWPTLPMDTIETDEEAWKRSFQQIVLRDAWKDRKFGGRDYIKYQLRNLAGTLASVIHTELGIPTAVAYSGSKGMHVYGFTGKIEAAAARDGAKIALDLLGCWKLYKGQSKYEHTQQEPTTGFPNFDVEVYPKQDSLEGKDLGNLLRLPLGRNQKSKDPTFFVDLRAPMGEWRPVDPIWALTTRDPWSD